MRPLTEEETKTLFEKLAHYVGSSLKNIIAPLDNSPKADRYVFRISGSRIYYVKLSLANLAVSVPRDTLLSLGICMGTYTCNPERPPEPCIRRRSQVPANPYLPRIGKFTKTGKVRLHITALPILAEHARYKLHIRPNGVMPFLYGSNLSRAHLARLPQDIPEHSGVIVCTQDDVPIGFGIMARSSAEANRLDPTGIVCFRQADCGEYLRDEDTLFAG
jgi:60S ribosome subunit biogenesis protein NIP7